MKHFVVLLAFLAIAAGPETSRVHIDFDDAQAPCTFAEAQPLTTRYASQGVVFHGGMEVLDQCGNFGVLQHSNRAFLAWNNGNAGNHADETLTFERPVRKLSFVAGSNQSGTLTVRVFDGQGTELNSRSISIEEYATPISVEAEGIARATITSNANFGAIDDLSFEY